jgi:hypothetical protein
MDVSIILSGTEFEVAGVRPEARNGDEEDRTPRGRFKGSESVG